MISPTFRKALEKQGVRVLAVDAGDGEPFIMPGFFPGSLLVSLMDNYPNADAIVSLAGIPYFEDAIPDMDALLISAYGATAERGVKEQVQSGLLSMAIIQRVSPVDEARQGQKKSREWFEQNLQVITAKNVALLSD